MNLRQWRSSDASLERDGSHSKGSGPSSFFTRHASILVKQQRQTRFAKRKPEARPQSEGESLSAMIQRVAQEHRLRSAANFEPEPPAPAAAFAPSEPAAAETPAAPKTPSTPSKAPPTIGTGDEVEVQRARCARGHAFAMLAEHPRMDGADACPHCMSSTIHEYRKIFATMVRPIKLE